MPAPSQALQASHVHRAFNLHGRADGAPGFALASGESLTLSTRPGDCLITSGGSLVLSHPPIWLGEQVFQARVPMEAGQSQVLDSGGWVTLTGGRHGGSVQLVAAPTPLAKVTQWWRQRAARKPAIGRQLRTA